MDDLALGVQSLTLAQTALSTPLTKVPFVQLQFVKVAFGVHVIAVQQVLVDVPHQK